MKHKFLGVLGFILVAFSGAMAQDPKPKTRALSKPKMVVGLVIDQMRWDYLYRFQAMYSANGFKRLLSGGFSCENTFIPYTPTYTAPGHASIYTGSVPAINGIIGNYWYDAKRGAVVYCTDDTTVTTLGGSAGAGKMSPVNLFTTTISDELKLSNNFKSKVIGIALKDRGAILPAGHSADAAYWYDERVGKMISSTYYMKELPTWVNAFNDQALPAQYMTKDWNTLFPIDRYDLSTPDSVIYESKLAGETSVTFPHRFSAVSKEKFAAFKYSPLAMTYTFDFAKEAIEKERLGKSLVTDFLAVSISSTDYVGHGFGPNSIEVQDMYLRLDRDIADFLQYLDGTLGKGNYLFFLSADHAVAHVPQFLKDNQIPSGTFLDDSLIATINRQVDSMFGVKGVIQSSQNYQFYLNHAGIKKQDKSEQAIAAFIIDIIRQNPVIVNAFATSNLGSATIPEPQKKMFINGYNTVRSGDIGYSLKPAYFDGWNTGTTHGSWNPHDSHIPLVFFGWKVAAGKTNRETYMTDIAATIAAMLQVQMPNGCVGKVITEITDRK